MGKEFTRFRAEDYAHHISERSEAWTYSKIPYLTKVGWKGFIDGPGSGVYRVGPLRPPQCLGGDGHSAGQCRVPEAVRSVGKPAHGTLAFHWARLIELLYAAERAVELQATRR